MIYIIDNFNTINSRKVICNNVFEKRSFGRNYSGTHNLEGIFIAEGRNIRKGIRNINEFKIYDVVPTILKLLGINKPNFMDGKIRNEILIRRG